MQQEKQRFNWKKIAIQTGLMALFVLVGLGFGTLLGRALRSGGASLDISFPLVIIGTILIIYLVLLTHELGHLLAGKLAGMRPFLLITGPLKIMATNRGLQVGLNTNLSLAGGLAACMPVGTHHLRRRLLLMAAGGPLASLFSGILMLLASRLLVEMTHWHLAFMVFGWTSLAIFVVTMIPTKTSGFMTDGAQILSLWRGGEDVQQRALITIIQAESMRGVRPRDYSPEILEHLLAVRTTPLSNALADLIGYYYHLDRGEIDLAGASLEKALSVQEQLPEGIKQAFYLEYAFYLAAYQDDPLTARKYLQRSSGALAEKHSLLRSQAAVLLAEGRDGEAHAIAGQALAAGSRAFDLGGALAEKAWLESLLASESAGQAG